MKRSGRIAKPNVHGIVSPNWYAPTVGCDVAWRSDGGELAVVEGDPECATAVGPIVGLAPATPQTTTTLVLEGENPAWQPVEVDRGG